MSSIDLFLCGMARLRKEGGVMKERRRGAAVSIDLALLLVVGL